MRPFGFGRARHARRRVDGALPRQLNALSLAANGVVENSIAGTVVGGVLGRTSGSALTLVDNAGGRFALSGGNLVAGTTGTDYEAANSHSVTVRETLDGYTTRDTVLSVTVGNVFEQPNLTGLSLSATTLTVGTAASGAITGATTASTIAATGLPGGFTINGAARTWAWSGSGSAGSATVTLTETLGDSANSPRSSGVGVTVQAATLPNWRAALAAARAGTAGPLIVAIPGDSTVAGTGGGNPASAIGNNARGNALSQKLGDSFAASGLAKNGADFFGFNFPINTQTAADYAAWNTSVTPGGWSYVANLISLGGNMWNVQGAAGGNLTWTAEGRPFDRLAIYYVRNSSLGTFRVKVDGIVVQTINSSVAGPDIGLVVVTGIMLGTHIVELEWISGSVYVIGMETLDTTSKASVRIRNLGLGSATSAAIVDNATAWRARYMLAKLEAAHLHIVEGGVINDWLQSAGTAATSANLTTMMTAATTNGGDVLLLGPTRSDPASTGVTLATQDGYVAAVAALANGTTRTFFDLKPVMGDYAAMSAAGRMYDGKHPNPAGYAAEAAAVYGAIA